MMKPYLSFILFCLLALVVNGRKPGHRSEVELSDGHKLDQKISNLVDVYNRQTRGIGSIIAMISLTTAQIGLSGFQLWTAVAEGCNIRRSICDDRAEIRRLEGLIKSLSDEYETVYYANQWKFLNLRQAMINNKYIMRYLNETVKAVETIGDIIDVITTKLEVDLSKMDEMYASGNSTTLEDLVGPFNHQLAEIEKLIAEMKHSQIVGLIIQQAVETFLEKTVNYVETVISRDRTSSFDSSTDSVLHRLSSSNSDLSEAQRSYWSRVKSYVDSLDIGGAFKVVGADIAHKFGTVLPTTVREWMTASRRWSTFKQKFGETFFGEESTIGKIRKFFEDPQGNIKYTVENFKFSKGEAFLQTVGIIIDAIQTATDTKAWIDVANQLSEARKTYQTYYEEAKAALAEVHGETTVLNNHWGDTITGFKSLVNQFNNVTNMANQNQVFSEVLGLSGHPIDTNDPFFHTDYTNTDDKSLKGKQDIVINFFRQNSESIRIVQDKFRVQEIVIEQTKSLTQNGDTVDQIFEFIRTIFATYKDSQTISSYSSTLNKKDVVCTTAMVLPNEQTYDFYPLEEFRQSKCDISDSHFATIEAAAADGRDKAILIKTVHDYVPNNYEPSTLLIIAQGFYQGSNVQRIKDFGARLTEKDIVCQIAQSFPDLNSYSLFDLTQFRPDCSRVDDNRFAQMKADVEKMKNAKSAINAAMQFCENDANSCKCPSELAGLTGMTEAQVNVLIDDYKQQHKPNCNYVENQGRCQWQC